MGSPARTPQTVHFADYSLDLQTAELRRNGTKVILQDQPFQILKTLLDCPGQLVTREELIKRLWPSDTFVDFDQSLNKAVARLREALGDSAEHPRFIETFPRRGYRFIAPLDLGTRAFESGSGRLEVVRAGMIGETEQVNDVPDLARRPRWSRVARLALVLLAGGIVLVASILATRASFSTATTSNTNIQSLAVLPLENLSGDPSQDYFADGMTDQLITDLGQISSLRVISRTSAMQYRGIHKPLPQIARALNVDAVVEGTVLRSGERVRITAQLIRATDDKHLWAQSYEGDFKNVLALQQKIANAIAIQVELTLTPHEQIRLGVEQPINPEAYESYLRGEYYLNRFTPDSISKAAEYFRQTISKDRNYAPAYTKLAGSYLMLGNMNAIPKKESHFKAAPLIDTALRIDPSFAAGHAVRGWSLLLYDLDFATAGTEFKRAIELNPNGAEGHQGLGDYYATIGQVEEAVLELKHARELDPLALIVNNDLCTMLYFARRYDDALAQCRANLDLDPNSSRGLYAVAIVYSAKGMDSEAALAFRQTFELGGAPPAMIAAIENGETAAGFQGQWRALLQFLRKDIINGKEDPMMVATAHTYAGNKDQAITWLERAFEARTYGVTYLGVDPTFDPLRSDPRFISLLSRIGVLRH
jgi:TolB-like protein/DNA-binding winged helix-turn-helix (wHTH) protein